MSFHTSDNAIIRALEKQSAANNKKLSIEKNIRIAEDAFNQLLPSIETDNGYKYFVLERERQSRIKDTSLKEVDTKISTLETKMDAIKEEFDNKMASLEARKSAALKEIEIKIDTLTINKERLSTEYDAKIQDYNDKAEDKRDKILNAKPTSLAYRKLLSSLEEAEKEIVEAKTMFDGAMRDKDIVMERHHKTEIYRLQQEATRLEREEKLIQKEALDAADARSKADHEAMMARYKARETPQTSIETSQPSKKPKTGITLPLDESRDYTWDILNNIEIDYDSLEITDTDGNSTPVMKLYEKKLYEASKREKIPGWWNNPLYVEE